MSSSEFEDAQKPFDAITSVIAEDSYVAYVIERLESGEKIDHPINNWNREMMGHILERYEVTRNVGHASISKCRENLRQNNGVSHAGQA